MSLTPEPPVGGAGPAVPLPPPEMGPPVPAMPADLGPTSADLAPMSAAGPGASPPVGETVQTPQMRATWSGVTVAWQGRWLFKDFSYAVPDGGIVGIVGPRGSAMDAALLALAGRYPLEAGTVAIVDAPDTVVVANLGTWELDDPLLTVTETVTQTARASAPTTNQANVVRCITAVGLHELADRPLGSLTSTERLRAALAAAAATGANVIAINASDAAGEPDEEDLWQLLVQLAGTGRLVLATNPRPHPAMNLVLSIPHGLEVPA